ncbi:MAG: carboxypeptidase-like regulatory domain-containing protein [Pyrinomonadaceae bacterium]
MKSWNRILMTFVVAGMMCLLLPAAFGPKQAQQQEQPQTPGSLTGAVTTPDKKPINNTTTLLVSGVFVDLQESRTETAYNPDDFHLARGPLNDVEGRSRQQTDSQLSGLYTFKNLRPGVYNLLVEAGQLPGGRKYRPQRIVGVVVKPGQETVLDITMHPGETLEFVGEPKDDIPFKYGWLEGTVTTPEGLPVFNTRTLLVSGVVVTIKNSKGDKGPLPTDHLVGGFFSFRRVLPGTYDLIIEKGRLGDTPYRPLIISGVEIKPGVRTVLNIVMHPGEGLERTAAPSLTTQPVQVVKP